MNWLKKQYRRIKAWLSPREGASPEVSAPIEREVSAVKGTTTAYEWAMTQLGVKEIKGWKHDKQIQKYLATVGMGGYSDETAWCAAFVNWCLAQAGIYGTGKPNARSFLKLGEETKNPTRGDIVVFWRESKSSWKGHVGFFDEFTPHGQVVCLGGNQDNRVCRKVYQADRVLSFRKVLPAEAA